MADVNNIITRYTRRRPPPCSWRLAVIALVSVAVCSSCAAPPALTAPLSHAEREKLVADFVEFVATDTESEDGSPHDLIPSTESQRDFSVALSKRLPWPRVEVDELGCMHAVIPGRQGTPQIALLAHVDTSPQVRTFGISLRATCAPHFPGLARPEEAAEAAERGQQLADVTWTVYGKGSQAHRAQRVDRIADYSSSKRPHA